LNLPNTVLQNLQNYSQSSAGFTSSLSYPLRRSFKRVGITYSFDRSSLLALSNASKNLFEFIAFAASPDRTLWKELSPARSSPTSPSYHQ